MSGSVKVKNNFFRFFVFYFFSKNDTSLPAPLVLKNLFSLFFPRTFESSARDLVEKISSFLTRRWCTPNCVRDDDEKRKGVFYSFRSRPENADHD